MGQVQQSHAEISAPALKVVSGEQTGRVYVLRDREVLIGRSDACEIVLNEEPVSRIHAKITLGSVIIMVKDLDSTNGTFVDDVKVEQMAWLMAATSRLAQRCSNLLRDTMAALTPSHLTATRNRWALAARMPRPRADGPSLVTGRDL